VVFVTVGGLKRFKPGVDKRVHLLLAALLWTVVGLFLLVRGRLWLQAVGKGWLFLPALLLGSGKSLFLLDKTAEKSINRILCFGDRTCLGAVYSIRTWLLVLAMIGTGYLLRQSSLPISLLGVLYATVGWALLLSSRLAWRAWLKTNG